MSVQKWGQDPEREAELMALDEQQKLAERNKEAAKIALNQWTMKAVEIVVDIMVNGNDNNEKLRAAEILFSRTIPKIASKHVEENQETIDSADMVVMREEIESLINKKRHNRGSNG